MPVCQRGLPTRERKPTGKVKAMRCDRQALLTHTPSERAAFSIIQPFSLPLKCTLVLFHSLCVNKQRLACSAKDVAVTTISLHRFFGVGWIKGKVECCRQA